MSRLPARHEIGACMRLDEAMLGAKLEMAVSTVAYDAHGTVGTITKGTLCELLGRRLVRQ